MSQPVGIPAPGHFPSFHCAVDQNIVDADAAKRINTWADRERRSGRIGQSVDGYFAGRSITALKGISKNKEGTALGNKLASRAFSIYTVGDLAKLSEADFDEKFRRGVEPLTDHQIELLSALRTALVTCKRPGGNEPAKIGHRVTVTENDPTMDAAMVAGREVVEANKGQDGYAELRLKSNPSNNGFVPSFLSVQFGAFGERGRGGALIEHRGFKVSVLASGTMQDVLERLKSAVEEHGLAADIQAADRGGASLRPGQSIRIWSPRAL